MAETASADSSWKLRIRRPSLVEGVVSLLIIVVAIVLLLPGEWVADGSIEVPVRVRVFDAAAARPIRDAQVAIIRARPPLPEFAIDEYREQFSREYLGRLQQNAPHLTGDDGTVAIRHEFNTSASHKNPEFRAHLAWGWVVVSAEGYGTVVVPVRYESLPTKVIREQGEVFVAVGLMPAE